MDHPHLHPQLFHLHLHSHNLPLIAVANDQAFLNLHSANLLDNPFAHIPAIANFIKSETVHQLLQAKP